MQIGTKSQPVASGKATIHNLAAIGLARSPYDWRKRLLASDLPAGTKVAGFAIAEWFINRESGYCFAGHETIGQRCGMTRRGIQDAIGRLVDAGFLRVDRRGFQQTNRTYLALPQVHAVASTDARGDVHQMHVVTCTEPTIYPTTKNNLTPSSELSVSPPSNDMTTGGGEPERPVEATDAPIRRGNDDHAARCFIGTAAVRLMGHETCPKIPDGRYLDRAIIDSLPPDVLCDMVRRNRKGTLMRSDVSRALMALSLPEIAQRAA